MQMWSGYCHSIWIWTPGRTALSPLPGSLWRISVWSTIFTIPSAENGWSATFTVSPERSCGCMYPGSRNRWNMRLIKSISRRSENGGRFLQICPGWHDFRLAEHRNEERSGGTDPACRRDFPRKYRSSPDPCGPLIWTFVHVCTYFGLFKSNAQFLCIAFFCPFSRLDSLHTIPIEKESTTKGALFYEIW